MVCLLDAKKNQCVTITSVLEDDDLSCRLHELGFLPGTDITLKNRLPFNGPLAIEVQGAKIALRYEDAKRILVS